MKKVITIIFLTILILIPINLFAITVTLSWVKSTSPDIKYYRIYQSTISGVYSLTPITIAPKTNDKITFTKISGTIYTYWIITAVDNNGNESIKTSELTTKWYIILKRIFGDLLPPNISYGYDDGNPIDYNICF